MCRGCDVSKAQDVYEDIFSLNLSLRKYIYAFEQNLRF